MNQQLNKLYHPLLALLFLIAMSQMVFGADDEISEPNTLRKCYPRQDTTSSLPPIPKGYPICEGAIEPTARATFDANTGKVILPAVRVNQKDGYVYSLELKLLSVPDDPVLTFEMTHYCLIPEPTSLSRNAEIATLTLPPGKIRIPAIDIGGVTYSADLDVEHPSTQVWEENEIFTRKKERVIFRMSRREVRQNSPKPNYPVLFVHGLTSSGQTWETYYNKQTEGWWQTKRGLTYGGNIYIRDKYHLFEQGDNANQNPSDNRLRSNYLSFFDIKVKKDNTLVDVKENVTADFYKKGDFYTMNFSNHKDISFAAQGLELKTIVNKICEWTESDGVYVVGHSMGGLATRAYLQYFNDNKVKGLITIGTPHYGSRDDMLGQLGSLGAQLFTGADIVEQLKQGSVDLNMLNEQCSLLPKECPLPSMNNVKYFFVVVKGDRGWFGEFSDKEGDGIVPKDSQWVNMGTETDSSVKLISGFIEVHTSEPNNSDIEQTVWNKLIEWSQAGN